MAASSSNLDDDIVVLEVRSPETCFDGSVGIERRISEIDAWELQNEELFIPPENDRIMKIRVHRNRLIEHSTYFGSLFGGGFKESSLDYLIVEWNLVTFMETLQFIYGGPLHVSFTNFVPLLEGALFFGVESLVIECKSWCVQTLSSKKMKISGDLLRQLIEIWNFVADSGFHIFLDLYAEFLALNFGGIMHCDSFTELPHALLKACISHPLLTVDSERDLCEALLNWLENNCQCSKFSSKIGENPFGILEKVRIGLLPLEFILGQLWVKIPSIVASFRTTTIFDHISCARINNHFDIQAGYLESFRLRLTQYSEKLDLSGCQQVTGMMLYFSLFPPGTVDAKSFPSSFEKTRNIFLKLTSQRQNSVVVSGASLHRSHRMAFFSDLQEVNFSCCWRIDEGDIIRWLQLSSPSLRVLKFSNCSQLKVSILDQLSEACPLIKAVDLSVDVSPVAQKISVLQISHEQYLGSQTFSNWKMWSQSKLSNLTNLSLKGRTDVTDDDLIKIGVLSHSLSVLNLNGCISLTDYGIGRLLSSCKQLRSLHAAWTSFGQHSIKELLSDSANHNNSRILDHGSDLDSSSSLVELDLAGCKGIDHTLLIKCMMSACSLSYLSLRDTHFDDEGLHAFKGTSLEELDVSETLVSGRALAYIIARNTGLKVLKVRGCKLLSSYSDWPEVDDPQSFLGNGGLFQALSGITSLQELSIGWGLSGFFLETLRPALRSLKSLTVGLGGSLSSQAWMLLPEICPSLECISVCFQVVSDEGIVNALQNLRYLHTLELQHCLGEITPHCLSVSAYNLKSLKLDRVAPWMTDDDLTILTQNFRSLSQLSLTGCKLLTSGAQHIIASGWPGLTSIHLEDCSNITVHGVSNLLECKAIQDLLLRHNGSGIQRSFILEAALKFPSLRTLSLDLCDACESGFDTPHYHERFSLCTVKLARCKFERCAFDFDGFSGSAPRIKHSRTIVLEWNSREIRTTIVMERL